MSVLEAALGLLREGFHPVILYPVGFVAWPGAEPKSGKEAIVRQWGQRPPFPEEIEELLDQYPGAGLGLCLGPGKGPGGRWLIDVEGDGPAAEESVAVLCDGEVVATRSWGSARGRHRLFYVDADRLRAIVANQGTVLKDPPGLPDLELRFGGAGKQLQSAVAVQWSGVACAPISAYTLRHERAASDPGTVVADRAARRPSRPPGTVRGPGAADRRPGGAAQQELLQLLQAALVRPALGQTPSSHPRFG